MSKRIARLFALVAALAIVRGAAAEDVASIPLGPNSLGACSGDAITPSQVIQGQFPLALMGSYVMVPFEVPAGTTQVRVKYCWEGGGHTVDLGIWQAREGTTPWGEAQFRGWGGSSHPDVALSAQGFSTEEQYLAAPKGHVPGRTTRGFLPGPIGPGTWAIELGVAAVVPVAEGDEDGLTDWRVEIETSSDPAFAAEPYAPAPYDETPAIAAPGWYAGDLHVHAEHSALGDATMNETFVDAFTSLEEGGAGLDFVTLTDYVTSSAWGEVGRHQAEHPGKLIARSSEIITYKGHTNAHGAHRYVDHRIGGAVYELALGDGALTLLRAIRTPAEAFAEIQTAGGVTQINHPTIWPSITAANRRRCRGCPWDYSAQDTDYTHLDAVEVHNGSPLAYGFTPSAILFWEAALDAGHHVAAVGVSDAHKAGCTRLPCDATQSPVGHGTTVVYAEELSEQGILDGIRAGHTYVKVFGNDGPDLRFEATGDSGETGIMGDTVAGPGADLRVTVSNLALDADTHTLVLVRDGDDADTAPIDAPGDTREFRVETPGRYRVELVRPSDSWIVALTSPIWVPEPRGAAATLAALGALASLTRRGRSVHPPQQTP